MTRISGHCPYCDSDQISGQEVDIHGEEAAQTVTCLHCEREWVDMYVWVRLYTDDGTEVTYG